MNRKRMAAMICAVILCMLSASSPGLARAGGGSSGGGGGGGSSSGRHTGGSYYSGRRSNPLTTLLSYGCFAVMASGGTIILVYKSRKAKRAAKKEMELFAKKDHGWEYSQIQERVRRAYFEIQECWSRQDVSYASEYMSRKLQAEFSSKLSWMKIQRKENVMRNVRLRSAVLVDACDRPGEEEDYLWYLIHGRMVDYCINLDTGQKVEGSYRPSSFYEYWKFIKEDGRWVLDEIRQRDEMDINQFLS